MYPEIKQQLSASDQLLISLAAGISLSELENGLGTAKLLRAMPNTPLAVLEGMTAVVANERVTEDELQEVLAIFNHVGKARVLPNSYLMLSLASAVPLQRMSIYLLKH